MYIFVTECRSGMILLLYGYYLGQYELIYIMELISRINHHVVSLSFLISKITFMIDSHHKIKIIQGLLKDGQESSSKIFCEQIRQNFNEVICSYVQ